MSCRLACVVLCSFFFFWHIFCLAWHNKLLKLISNEVCDWPHRLQYVLKSRVPALIQWLHFHIGHTGEPAFKKCMSPLFTSFYLIHSQGLTMTQCEHSLTITLCEPLKDFSHEQVHFTEIKMTITDGSKEMKQIWRLLGIKKSPEWVQQSRVH